MTLAYKAKLAVLVSGNGSNLQAILDACDGGELPAEVGLVVSNRPEAYALKRAEASGVESKVLEAGDFADRKSYDAELANIVSWSEADLVVLAGWDRLLSFAFLNHHIVMNLHPSLPGVFPGLGAIEKAFEAWQRGEISSGGVMVHFVPNEGVDDGPVIASEGVDFVANDTLDTYRQRVQQVEHRLLVDSIKIVLAEQIPQGVSYE